MGNQTLAEKVKEFMQPTSRRLYVGAVALASIGAYSGAVTQRSLGTADVVGIVNENRVAVHEPFNRTVEAYAGPECGTLNLGDLSLRSQLQKGDSVRLRVEKFELRNWRTGRPIRVNCVPRAVAPYQDALYQGGVRPIQ